jgi:5'-methylthioadenosine phosphorylase
VTDKKMRRRIVNLVGRIAGTYVCIEGPQFSSLAESLTYKNLGYSVIGMTNMPEAELARESEICYAPVAMITDFDCWHPDHEVVTVQDIIKVLNANVEKAKRLVAGHRSEFSPRARAVPDRVGSRSRQCFDNGPGGARFGSSEET